LYTISCDNSVQLHQTMPELENAVYNWYDPETDFPDTVDFGSIFRITRVGTASNIVLAQTLTLDITETEVTEGTEFDLTATVGPDNVTNPTLAWSSNNHSVATVDSKGHVKVLRAGECYITVRTTDSSNLLAACHLRATADPTTGITAVESDPTGSAIFDLTGRRLSAVTSSGLYIVNGRKTYIRR
ncbi:MAG: Ig-like domain-containing protein, partial [Muribaculaceae bacterium]|nr:Ig-like domain-containing protein [Muribaculaceae bacterium]